MTTLRKKVRAMRWRLEWINFNRRFVRLLLAGLVLIAIFIAAEKFFALPVDSFDLAQAIIGATIPLALIWAVFTRTSHREAAIATDKQVALRERISSALSLDAADDPMEQLVVADAESHAKPLRPHKVFPMPVWRDVYYMPVPIVLAALIALFVPDFKKLPEPPKEGDQPFATESQRELANRLEVVQREMKEIRKADLPPEFKNLTADMEQLLRDLESQNMTRASVMKRLSKMTDSVEDRKAEMEKQLGAAQKAQQLYKAEMTKKLVDALSKGNFAQAKAEMSKLAQKAKDGEMSEDEQKKLEGELDALAKALQDNPQLSKALAQAAANMKAGDMQGALNEMQLSEQEMQALADALQNMKQMEQMGEMLQAMQGMPCGNCGSSTCSACMNMQAMLAEMGKFRTGETNKPGSGMGGPGIGRGGVPQFDDTSKTNFQDVKTRYKMDKGDVIGVIKVWGPQLKGEATEEFEQAYLEYSQNAEDTLVRENIPLEFRTVVRNYFDAIRPQTMTADPDAAAGAGGETTENPGEGAETP